jgi:hypothetical protein
MSAAHARGHWVIELTATPTLDDEVSYDKCVVADGSDRVIEQIRDLLDDDIGRRIVKIIPAVGPLPAISADVRDRQRAVRPRHNLPSEFPGVVCQVDAEHVSQVVEW